MSASDNNVIAVRFGAFIKEARLNKNLTQQDMADKLKVSQSYYNRIEVGGRNVDLFLALDICSLLDLDLDEFKKSLNLERV